MMICNRVWFFVLVFFCGLFVRASDRVNYCSSKMCSHTNAHTFCQFSEGPGMQCTGYMEAPLSNQEKARVLTRLNQRRAATASGRLRGFPTAGNMLKLLWIDELAREAQLWADQCEPPKNPEENDDCRDLFGQCVASVVGEAPGLRPESMVDMWYMQSRHYTGNVTHYELPKNNAYYGDFAQLVYAKAYMVGCGRSRFMVPIHGRLRSVERLVCNFAPRGPITSRPMWTVASPASDCPPRSQADDVMPALCSIRHNLDESLDQDNLMSLEEHVLLDTIFDVEKNESLNYVGSIDELYLTKIAIATIGTENEKVADTISMQKRDLMGEAEISKNDLLEGIINEIEKMDSINATTEVTANTSPLFKSQSEMEQIKLVGRPKSYKIEDLTDGAELKRENPEIQMEDIPNTASTLGIDYEFIENVDVHSVPRRMTTDSFTSTSTSIAALVVTENATVPENYLNYSESTSVELYGNTTQSTTLETTLEAVTYLENDNATTLSVNDTDALIDEYLNDPETFRQLQEELERMEMTLSTELPSTDRSDKVRRDLRNRPNRAIGISNGTENSENGTLNIQQLARMLQEEESNRTADGPPSLFNMAMRYMPYLKNYKTGLLKRAVGSSSRSIISNFTLVLTLLVFNIL